MSYPSIKPRLSVEITEAQDDALKRLIPYALKSPLVRAMLDTLIRLLEKNHETRHNIITFIISGELDIAKATLSQVVGEESSL